MLLRSKKFKNAINTAEYSQRTEAALSGMMALAFVWAVIIVSEIETGQVWCDST